MPIAKVKALYLKYERVLMPATLVFGLIVDYITFRTIQIESAFLILLLHYIVAGSIIAFMTVYDERIQLQSKKVYQYLRLASTLILQFTFGALLSASFIFYWFSGSFSISWPFILILAGLMISNDVFREYYQKPLVTLGIYFFITFSLLTLTLPYLLNSINIQIFILGGIASLLIFFFYIRSLNGVSTRLIHKKRQLILLIAIIFLGMNALYMTNRIPPIPLSLVDAGIYHNIERQNSNYLLESEPETFFERLWPGQTIHLKEGRRAFAFSSIFAPSDLDLIAVHHWQKREDGKWITKSKASFPIVGGRAEGYRGFSFSNRVNEGKWRVLVETERGQVIGRILFDVEYTDETIQTEVLTK